MKPVAHFHVSMCRTQSLHDRERRAFMIVRGELRRNSLEVDLVFTCYLFFKNTVSERVNREDVLIGCRAPSKAVF